jgi:hypothetical protein
MLARFARWVSGHRSLVMTATGSTVIAGLIAAVAIVSTGYTAQKLDLQDSAVWVSNGAEQAVGRINTQVSELNSVMPGVGTRLDVLQDGATVLVVDRDNSVLDMVDAATSTVSQKIPLPPNDPQVFLASGTVTIISGATGAVWIVPLTGLADFDATALPTLNLGSGIVASIDSAGRLFAYSSGAKKIYEIRPDVANTIQAADPLSVPAGRDVSVSSVNGTWAVLDATGRRLYLPGRTVGLGTVVGTPVLQQPGVDGTGVLVADSAGLRRVPIDGGAPTLLVSSQSGVAARPLSADGCIYGAWTGGTAWRQCSASSTTGAATGSNGTLLALASLPADGAPVFQSNSGQVLLNDTGEGGAWAVQSSGRLINNWADLLPVATATPRQQTTDAPVDAQTQQQPPVAVDDAFGARPGRATVLPVLLNDYDPNGDVLSISAVPTVDAAFGRVDLINNGQELQITLTAGATGAESMRYSISDGRGGTASATVVVTVHTANENSPPEQVRPTNADVGAGGRVTTQVLSDWVDPDGDPFYLASASVAAPDSVSFQPQGSVAFAAPAADTSPGTGPSSATVILGVSDGTATGTGSLTVAITAAGEVPIIADPFLVQATSGVPITIAPLGHVRGGSGEVRLASVPGKAGVTITPSLDKGTFTLTSTVVGTHYLDYVVTDGDQTVTGVLRVDVSAASESTRPITIPKTVFVQTLGTQSIDVADSDIDPAGGVLLVTGVMGLPRASGVSADVVQQSVVQVRLTAPLAGPVTFSYRISNGLADADGTITVIQIPAPAALQPPIANDDEVTVRVGAAIDIPVLANDEQPDGAALTLMPALPQDLPAGDGLLFSSGTVLRYLAPERTGNFLAVYEIEGPDGQKARAQLRIAVREPNVDTNSAPVPLTVTARALAGETITIPIPLSGIDPDGDTVQLLGQQTNPHKGSVVDVGADSITYRAGDYSAGTDTFEYAVIDALGARATGTVLVGIAARPDGARNPVATIDEVAARPGTTVSVQVLANDSDPDGSPLSVVSAVPNDKRTRARVSGDLVVISPPKQPGVYAVVYTIQNELGGTSSNFVRVTVDPAAPLSYPVVTDTVLTLSDIVGRKSIDVNVLANVFFADGDPSGLLLTVYPGYTGVASVTAGKRIHVTISAKSQIIPFRVANPRNPTISSYGFIWVPGFDDALPQINRDAAQLTVTSEKPLVINLNDYVLAEGGRKVHLADSSSVRATNANGANLVTDSSTLTFTSADRYFGAASISFEVTDGTSATDPAARTATIVLPITVLPRDNQPPVFGGADLDFEPGQQKVIDLTRLTAYPYPADMGELVYRLLSLPAAGFTATLSGQRLTLTAGESARTGSVATMSLGVADGLAAGQSGRIQLTVVPSTRPLARAADVAAVVRRGQSTIVDVLAGDNATNPFPGNPLTVIAIRGVDSAALPAGVRVTPSADRSTLTVTVAADAVPSDSDLQYEIADVTGDPARDVWGTVHISVQDRPDPVAAVRVTAIGDQRLTVAWNSGAANNAPITGYRVVLTDAGTGAVVSSTTCTGSLCPVSTAGNGTGNAVRIAVTATNAIGTSDPASGPGTVWSDVIPAAPAGLSTSPLDHGVRISWQKPAVSGGGTAITSYLVAVQGTSSQQVAEPAADPVGTAYSVDVVDPSIVDGVAVGVTVSARNQASTALTDWNHASATAYPAGAPLSTAAPRASVNPDDPGNATLSWSGSFAANGRDIGDYYATVFTGEAPTCGVTGSVPGAARVPADTPTFQHAGAATSATFTNLTPNTTYQFAVYAFNGMGCTASAVVEATPRVRPGTVTRLSVDGPAANGTVTWDFSLSAVTIASGSTDADTFLYRLSGGSVEGGQHGPLPLGAFLDTPNSSQYGQDVSVEVKACKTYAELADPVCSADWSTVTHVGVPVANSALAGLVLAHTPYGGAGATPATGTWSWSASPTGDYTSVTYSCGGNRHTLVAGDGGQCDVVEGTGAQAGAMPDLTVTVTAGGTGYSRTYTGSDYDQ